MNIYIIFTLLTLAVTPISALYNQHHPDFVNSDSPYNYPPIRPVRSVHAVAVLRSRGDVYGTIYFDQEYYEGAPVRVRGRVYNLKPPLKPRSYESASTVYNFNPPANQYSGSQLRPPTPLVPNVYGRREPARPPSALPEPELARPPSIPARAPAPAGPPSIPVPTTERTARTPELELVQTPGFVPVQNPGFIPNKTPGFVTNKTLVVVPVRTTGFVPNQTPGFIPNQTPGFASDQTPGFVPVQTPGFAPDQSPGFLPDQTPGFVPVQTPGFVPNQTPGFAPDQTPGFVPIQIPRFVSNQPPGFVQGEVSGFASNQSPGFVSVLGSGFVPNETPGFIPVEPPGFVPNQTPGFGTVQKPGFVPVQSPGFGLVQNPGFIPIESPGFIPVQSPAFAPVKSPGFIPVLSPGFEPSHQSKFKLSERDNNVQRPRLLSQDPSFEPSVITLPTGSRSQSSMGLVIKNPEVRPNKQRPSTELEVVKASIVFEPRGDSSFEEEFSNFGSLCLVPPCSSEVPSSNECIPPHCFLLPDTSKEEGSFARRLKDQPLLDPPGRESEPPDSAGSPGSTNAPASAEPPASAAAPASAEPPGFKREPSEKPSLHGIHIHRWGNLTQLCHSVGDHFNPDWTWHGSPQANERHVGDLGNIWSDAPFDFEDNHISLFGRNNIIGRSVVVHERDDDFGKGNSKASRLSGDSGTKVACGVIAKRDFVYF